MVQVLLTLASLNHTSRVFVTSLLLPVLDFVVYLAVALPWKTGSTLGSRLASSVQQLLSLYCGISCSGQILSRNFTRDVTSYGRGRIHYWPKMRLLYYPTPAAPADRLTSSNGQPVSDSNSLSLICITFIPMWEKWVIFSTTIYFSYFCKLINYVRGCLQNLWS